MHTRPLTRPAAKRLAILYLLLSQAEEEILALQDLTDHERAHL